MKHIIYPRREIALLLLAAAFTALALLTLMLAPAARQASWFTFHWRGDYLISLGLWLLAAIGGHLLLHRTLPHRDPYLFPIAMLLSGWGIALVWRLAPAFGLRQSLWVMVGVAAMALTAGVPGVLRWIRRYRYLWLTLALTLTAATFVLGVNPSGFGPRLWLGLGRVYFQPAEILKLLLVAYLAAYLADHRELIVSNGTQLGRWQLPSAEYLSPVLLMWGFSLVLLFIQRDLGAGSLIFAVFLAMLYLTTGESWYVGLGIGLMVVGGAVLYLLFAVVRVRIDGWLNPWLDPSGDSFQIVQSLIAIANGGVLGRGFGAGSPTVIPVVHSDFIYAAIVEEWGLAGGLGVLMLILVLVVRALHNATHAPNGYQVLLGSGLAALLAIQTIFIVGGVIRALPLTGVTLPFLSYGGSALLINFFALGLLLRLSHRARSRS